MNYLKVLIYLIICFPVLLNSESSNGKKRIKEIIHSNGISNFTVLIVYLPSLKKENLSQNLEFLEDYNNFCVKLNEKSINQSLLNGIAYDQLKKGKKARFWDIAEGYSGPRFLDKNFAS